MKISILFVFTGTLLLNGCAISRLNIMQEMSNKGQHQNVVNYFEENYTYDSPEVLKYDSDYGDAILYPLCRAYFELRNYKKFAECSQVYIENTDKNGYPWGRFPASYGDIVAPIISIRSRVHMDFGNYPAAMQEAEKAVLLLKDSLRSTEYLRKSDAIEVYGAAGLAHAFSGNRSKAEAYILQLNKMKSLFVDEYLAMPRHFAIAQIHMAL